MADTAPPFEQHFSAAALAELWGLHRRTVQDLFRHEPGVVVLGAKRSGRYRKAYTTLRIPASVAERVHRRLQNQ